MLDVVDDHVSEHPRPFIFLDFFPKFALEPFNFGDQMLLLDTVFYRIRFARLIAFGALVSVNTL